MTDMKEVKELRAINGYLVPTSAIRVAIARLIDMAEGCGVGPMIAVEDRTLLERASEAIAFLAATLRVTGDDELREVIAREVARHQRPGRGLAECAREVYANLMVLEDWIATFYGRLSGLFLCSAHMYVSDAQRALADRYANEDSESPDEEAEALSDAIQESLQRTYDHERH